MLTARALFLDRDGVINHDAGYTSSIESFQFIDGIFELAYAANQAGYLLIVVTNQAGIGRGYYSEQDFLSLTNWMCQRFSEKGSSISEVLYCPYHPTHGTGKYKKESPDRKPNPGMLLRAAQKYALSMQDCIMVGDKDSDMVAAINAGVGVRCQYKAEASGEITSTSATHVVHSLRDVTLLLLDEAITQATRKS